MQRLTCSRGCGFSSELREDFSWGRNGERQQGCKTCWNAYCRENRTRHRAKIAATSKRRREEHPELVKEQRRASYRRNRAQHIATVQKWQAENADKVKSYRTNTRHRRRAQSAESDITAAWARGLRTATDVCECCGVTLVKSGDRHCKEYTTLDHIVPLNAGGKHTMENVRYICLGCNVTRPHDGSDVLCSA